MRFDHELSANESWLWQRVGRLGRLRRANEALRRGTRTDLVRRKDQIAYALSHGQDTVLLALNRSSQAVRMELELPKGSRPDDENEENVLVDCFGLPLENAKGIISFVLPPLDAAVITTKGACDAI